MVSFLIGKIPLFGFFLTTCCILLFSENNMVFKIFLAITILLHFFAAVVAVKLTKVTKYNLSWMLISAALVLMAVRRVMDFLPLYTHFDRESLFWLYSWMGILTSLFLAAGVFLIQKIFRYMRKVEQERRNYEKRLLNAVVQAEENERRRFANELHDGLGPLLSSIKMGLSVVAAEKKEVAVARNLEEAVQEAIATVREISNNLSPHILTHFGLEKAVRNFICRLALPDALVVHPSLEIGSKRYENTIEIVMYRVFGELVHNTVQHADASRIDVRLFEADGCLVLQYHDDGIGFDPKAHLLDSSPGLGYFNMVSRVSSLKGEVLFGDQSSSGTFVTVKIPLK